MLYRVIFSLFVYLFLGFSKGDVLTYIFSRACGRPVPYFPWFWAIAATLTLLLIEMAVGRIRGRRERTAMSPQHGRYGFLHRGTPPCFPGMMATAFLAIVLVSWPFCTFAYIVKLLIASLLIYGVVRVILIRFFLRSITRKRRWWTWHVVPLIHLIAVGLLMGIGAAATDVTHYELRTAYHLGSPHPEQAYQVGEKSLATSPRLFALRCYLMTSDSTCLGSKIFEQPVPPTGGSALLLLPDDVQQQYTFPSDRLQALLGVQQQTQEKPLAYFQRAAHQAGLHPGAAADYYLCALLLERQIDAFAAALRVFYKSQIESHTLPTYYAQAMIMYKARRAHPIVRYEDPAIEENYRNYSEMGDTIAAPDVRYNLTRRSYGNTYWWYFDYAPRLHDGAIR